jgi:hypothetical protein
VSSELQLAPAWTSEQRAVARATGPKAIYARLDLEVPLADHVSGAIIDVAHGGIDLSIGARSGDEWLDWDPDAVISYENMRVPLDRYPFEIRASFTVPFAAYRVQRTHLSKRVAPVSVVLLDEVRAQAVARGAEQPAIVVNVSPTPVTIENTISIPEPAPAEIVFTRNPNGTIKSASID